MVGYLVAIFLPPVPMFQQGRMVSFFITLVLWLTVVGWPIASILAVMATRGTHVEDKRVARLVKAQSQPIVVVPQPQVPRCGRCNAVIAVGQSPCPQCGAAVAW